MPSDAVSLLKMGDHRLPAVPPNQTSPPTHRAATLSPSRSEPHPIRIGGEPSGEPPLREVRICNGVKQLIREKRANRNDTIAVRCQAPPFREHG
jgi:hypothetical protein